MSTSPPEEPWPPLCPLELERGPRLTREPVLSRAARRTRTEGWVDLKLELSESGKVTRVAVRDAFPKGVFEDSVLEVAPGWYFFRVDDSSCGTHWYRYVVSYKGGQMEEVGPALRSARTYLNRCEYRLAASAARLAREGKRNPQLVLEAALIESAAIEVHDPGRAEVLLESYASVAPDTDSVEAARDRALRYIPDYCRD